MRMKLAPEDQLAILNTQATILERTLRVMAALKAVTEEVNAIGNDLNRLQGTLGLRGGAG